MSLTLISHLGLGDSILVSGAAVELAKQHGKLRVPAYEQYIESVKSFYVNHPEIEVFPVDNPEGSNWGSPPIECFKVIGEPIMCGVYGRKIEDVTLSWPETFYQQLGVDFSHRWDSCPLQKAWQHTGPQVLLTPRYFVHDDTERGYVITKLIPKDSIGCFRPAGKVAGSILRFVYAMAQAQEVHVIDSCFYHLCESIDTFGNLYLHRYARGMPAQQMSGGGRTIQHDYPTRKTWHIIT